jgi:hypothetical protein
MILNVDPGYQTNTVVPDISMSPSDYEFHGDGPNGDNFNINNEQLPIYQRGLESGEWTISVNVKNNSDIIIAQGTQGVSIHPGEIITCQIPIRPVLGHGILNVSVLWNEADIDLPSLQGRLTLDNGTSMAMDFGTLNPGSAQCILENIPTGYHTLIIQLLDNDVHVAGAVEVIRIIDSQTSFADFEFFNLNETDGDVSIVLTPQMDEPLNIELAGQADEILEGEIMTVTATVPGDVGPVEYIWYLNGEYKNTGDTLITENTLRPGVYRLDVAAFTSDHRRAGSLTHTFTVIEASSVTLMWDPNAELDLKGYKLYYGTASGVYPKVVDVGNNETCTVPLRPGETYYFAATAYNMALIESTYSNEVVYTVPL